MIHSARFPWGDSVCTLVFCTESGVHHSLLRRDLEILGRNVPPRCCLRLLGGQFSLSRYLGVLSSLRPFVTLPAAFCECLRGFLGKFSQFGIGALLGLCAPTVHSPGRRRAAGSRAKEEHGRAAPSLGRSPPAAVPKQCVTSRHHARGPAGGEPERVRSATAARTARPNNLGHTRNWPSPIKGKSGPNAQLEKKGAARGPERPCPVSGCQQLSPPPPRARGGPPGQTLAMDPPQGRGGRGPPDCVQVSFFVSPIAGMLQVSQQDSCSVQGTAGNRMIAAIDGPRAELVDQASAPAAILATPQ
ncbi:hypothetical protein NDU88_005587 [Pleurodeles waltl]|uniref:Uncharacterized protein n=1 Tax=Pleurodeles waltl TaxID=8319 RepID=A0AAV7UIJ3_PLEWA|nr:hypothetical protein NDU88_005587 [Pleurodeles waltl]